jgi:uncharacterized protein DUF6362
MSELKWTAAMVEERLVEAADVLNRMPERRVQGFYSLWPQIAPTFNDLIHQRPQMRRPLPSPAAIDRMEETLGWFKWLEPPDTKIVWLRASGKRWKMICYQVGLSRPAAWQHWATALCSIAMRLNGERVPKHRVRTAHPRYPA